MTEKEQMDQCVCCKCHSVFSQYETVTVERRIYGINVKEKRCPYCEGVYKKIEVPKILDKFLFINTDDRYYAY